MNKKMQNNYENYLRSTDYKLDDVYKSYSIHKSRAWQYCDNLCLEHGGRDLRIVSHNCMMFTAGFIFQHHDTGELCYMHITKTEDKWGVIS